MLIALLLVQVATPVVFTPEAARALTPAALADALLGAGHAPIAAAVLHPVGMDAPTASLQAVDLVGVPGVDPDPRWCRRVDFHVALVPVDSRANAWTTTVPTRVGSVTAVQYRRLATSDCAAAQASFFMLFPGSEARQLALVERMLAARTLARGRRPLPFRLTCADRDGAKYPSLGGDRCAPDQGRTLLARFRLESAGNVSLLHPAPVVGQRPTQVERPAEIDTFDDALAVDAVIEQADGRITAITLTRHIPYPF